MDGAVELKKISTRLLFHIYVKNKSQTHIYKLKETV